MKPTFHLAPRFTIQPPPNGPLHLGTIIDNLIDVEPVNEDCRLPLPGRVFDHRTSGFTASRSQLASGQCGIWATFLVVAGLGGAVSLSTSSSSTDTFRFEHLDEMYFTATERYVTDSMNVPDVRSFVEGGGYEPVYMITGLKIARGPAVSTSRGRSCTVAAEVGVSQPGGVPLEVGPKVERTTEKDDAVEWETSDDFVFGIRVKRLQFKRGLPTFLWGSGVAAEAHHRGATLVGHDNSVHSPRDVPLAVEVDEIEEDDEELEEHTLVKDGNEIWVIPKSPDAAREVW